MSAKDGDLVFFSADRKDIVNSSMSVLIKKLGSQLNLLTNEWKFLWILDYPLFEKDSDGNPTPLHHPFTAPSSSDIKDLDSDPSSLKSRGYDLTMNGYEIAGGSIRNHQPDFQSKIFELLGMDKKEINSRFGFLVDALKYGTPPHGGIAFGFDRLIMILSGSSNICLLYTSPSPRDGLLSRMPSSA